MTSSTMGWCEWDAFSVRGSPSREVRVVVGVMYSVSNKRRVKVGLFGPCGMGSVIALPSPRLRFERGANAGCAV